jgi:hypothetical protein
MEGARETKAAAMGIKGARATERGGRWIFVSVDAATPWGYD